MSKGGIWTIVAIVLVGILFWHFLIKSYNYRISFITKDPAGLVYSNLNSWQALKGLEDSSSVIATERLAFETITQEVSVNDSLFEYRWSIQPVTDSTTRVTVYITDLQNAWIQNLYTPVYKNDFVKRSLKTVQELGSEWVDYRDRYRVGAISEGQVNSQFCAYLSVETTSGQKARTMMTNIADVMGYVNSNALELAGDPFLQVTKWDRITDSISFDFCFPIKRTDSLPESAVVKFKEVEGFKGIKTIFNGNYSISDKSWYWLIRHAENNNLQVEYLPFEIYKNDPHMGGDPLKWDAEVYLPLQNQ